ncbi:MAG: hypothetical protein KJZ86_02510 [Caldilineaceae bacterium]|nr:hypothetical protein [Caldilineaceae bacterium]
MRRYLPLAVVLLITAVLVVSLDNFLQEMIIQPLLYAVWFAGLVVSSLHQSIFWGVLLFVALVLILRSLGGGERIPATVPEKRYPSQGQVRRWMGLLERAESQRFARWNLAQSLRKLAQETINPEERQRREKRRVDFEERLTPDIANYFNAKLPPAQGISLRQRLQIRPTHSSNPVPSHPLDLDPEVVVAFLEREAGRVVED